MKARTKTVKKPSRPSSARSTASKPSRMRAFLVGAGVLVVLVIIAVLVWKTVGSPTAKIPDLIANAPQTDSEAVRADVIGNGLSSSAITVLGVRVGMTEQQVLDLLGPADKAQEYDFGAIQNWEYGSKLGLNSTGVTLHLRQGIVTRIMLYPAMNTYLSGATRIEGSKEDIYAELGLPNRQYDIRGGRYFVYNDRGLEVFFGPYGETSLGVVFEGRKLPTTATFDTTGLNVTKPAVPRLIGDTTTLCNQGATFAFNMGTGVCREYANACAIPDNEVEVQGCEPEFTTDEAVRAAIIASW